MDNEKNFLKIVVADDDADDRFLAKSAFNEIGFSGSLEFAEDGEELMCYLNQCLHDYEKLQSRIPDLIILDLNMPVKNGWETLKELKRSPGLEEVSIVIWSTSDNEEDKNLSIEMGADYFITKPCDYTKLLSSFRSLVKIFCSENEKM